MFGKELDIEEFSIQQARIIHFLDFNYITLYFFDVLDYTNIEELMYLIMRLKE